MNNEELAVSVSRLEKAYPNMEVRSDRYGDFNVYDGCTYFAKFLGCGVSERDAVENAARRAYPLPAPIADVASHLPRKEGEPAEQPATKGANEDSTVTSMVRHVGGGILGPQDVDFVPLAITDDRDFDYVDPRLRDMADLVIEQPAPAIDLQVENTRLRAELEEAKGLLESVDDCEKVTSSTLAKISEFLSRGVTQWEREKVERSASAQPSQKEKS